MNSAVTSSSWLQIERVMQLHLACTQRIGVIIVGPPGSGKSTLWRLLRAALMRLNRAPILHVVNPKAMPRHQLLGDLEPFDGYFERLRGEERRAGRLAPKSEPCRASSHGLGSAS